MPSWIPTLPWYGWAGLAGLFVVGTGIGKAAAAPGSATASKPGGEGGSGGPPRPAGAPPLLKLGSSGPWVAYLRSLLGLSPGESFDEETRVAAVAFQTSKGLTPDGLVGKNTWGALGVTGTAPKPAPGPGPTPPPDFLGAGTGGPLDLSENVPEREGQILAAVAAGAADHEWVPLSWNACGHSASILVSRRALALSDGANRLIVSMTFNGAQKLADLIGGVMLTTRMADEIHKQAATKITPTTRSWNTDSPVTGGKTSRMKEQSATIDGKVAGAGGLVSNEGKDWVLTRRFWLPPDGTGVEKPHGSPGSRHNSANFGWYPGGLKSPAGVSVIQSIGLVHDRAAFVDYSQLTRFCNPDSLFVDGVKRSLFAVLSDPDLSCVVQDEGGIIPDTRHPDT